MWTWVGTENSFLRAPIGGRAGKKYSLTPLLTVIFIGSYGLMTMLIVEQGNTIQSQSNLIQILQRDSRELLAGKVKAQTEQAARQQAQNQAQLPLAQAPATRGLVPAIPSPPSQAPANQIPLSKTPPSPVDQKPSQKHPGAAAKPKTQAPPEALPPVPASDPGDQRRVLISL